MDPSLLISLAVFLVIAFIAVVFAFFQQDNSQKDRARQIITGRAPVKEKSETSVQNQRRADLAKKLKEQEAEEGKNEAKVTIRDRIQQAGLDFSAKQYFIYSGAAAVVLTGLTLALGLSPLMAIFAAIIGFFGVPRFMIGWLAKQRQKKFMDEFADALEAMVRLLKAGLPVGEAIAMIAREYKGPIGEEMARIYDSQKIGIPLHEAAQEATKRVPLTEVKMFATGLSIQAQTGSSLSEVLTNLANVIRSRYKLARKVRALSSEAKTSAFIIGSLPVVVATGIYFLNPDHIMILTEFPLGRFLLGLAAVWMIIGVIIMKVMINFKV